MSITRAKGGKRMNIVAQLSQLMKNKGINKSQLSKGANIPYTTIDGIFKKGCNNIKLGTLIKLADYFNVSIDYLVGRENIDPEVMMFQEFLQYKRGVNNGQN